MNVTMKECLKDWILRRKAKECDALFILVGITRNFQLKMSQLSRWQHQLGAIQIFERNASACLWIRRYFKVVFGPNALIDRAKFSSSCLRTAAFRQAIHVNRTVHRCTGSGWCLKFLTTSCIVSSQEICLCATFALFNCVLCLNVYRSAFMCFRLNVYLVFGFLLFGFFSGELLLFVMVIIIQVKCTFVQFTFDLCYMIAIKSLGSFFSP